MIAIELATVRHQGRRMKMLGELAPGSPAWRAKTRPKNKLRLNMKKLLNPRINTKEVTVINDDSSDEKPKIKKEAVLKTPVSHHAKGKNPSKAAEEVSLTETKLSIVFLELRNEMIKEEQQKEAEVSYSKDQLLIDEDIPKEADTQENPSIPDISTDLLEEDADIFRKLNIPWMPTDV